MDSLTQATLGAAVGHICWHEKLGRKAIIAGALLGTLPDLDVLIYPFLDEVQRLYWHRGESHSVWFMILGAMAFGWLLRRLTVTETLSYYQAGIGALFIFSSHVLIDLFNVYGTQLFAPVFRKGFALDNMFIIDPLFTVPLLIGTAGAYYSSKPALASKLNRTCLLLASIYVVWSFSAQTVASFKFRQALAEQKDIVSRQFTSAGSFTTFLWRHIAETPDGFLLAYWSWFDAPDKPIRFHFIPQNAAIVGQIKNARTFQVVDWFSHGWWFVAEADGKSARVVDLRFGEIPSDTDQNAHQWAWPFAWEFYLNPKDETRLKAIRPELKDPLVSIRLLLGRILGRSEWIAASAQYHPVHGRKDHLLGGY